MKYQRVCMRVPCNSYGRYVCRTDVFDSCEQRGGNFSLFYHPPPTVQRRRAIRLARRDISITRVHLHMYVYSHVQCGEFGMRRLKVTTSEGGRGNERRRETEKPLKAFEVLRHKGHVRIHIYIYTYTEMMVGLYRSIVWGGNNTLTSMSSETKNILTILCSRWW